MTRPGPETGIGSERGFTLIEALVALAIGGFVIATLATVTGQWMRSWRQGFPTLQRSELLVASLDSIAADLAAARFLPYSATAPGIVFAGDETSVTFVRRSLPVEDPAGLEMVRLAPLPGARDVTLVRSRAALRLGAVGPMPTDPLPVVLLRPPLAIRFAYADLDQHWQATWQGLARLPRLIKVEVVDKRTGRGTLTPLVVRVHVDAPLGCATLAAAAQCDAALGLQPAPNQPAPAPPTVAQGQL